VTVTIEQTAFGGGNVFDDLGLPDAEDYLAKADLASKIATVIEARDLTQTQAAALCGVSQPKISLIIRGRLDNIGTDRLCRILNRLGVTVSLVLTEEPEWRPGTTAVA
jgi:predicted XRE-type DNA-binding protein